MVNAQRGSIGWNAMGLGSTAAFAAPLVYNTKRSGAFELGGRRFVLRLVAFPPNPQPEWFVVDLFENADQAGASRAELAAALTRALGRGTFKRERLREMAERYGTKATQALVEASIRSPGRRTGAFGRGDIRGGHFRSKCM
jgi:hypothetical protein